MKGFRDIDAIVKDATICITISDYNVSEFLDLSEIPNINDEVSIGIGDCSIIVEVLDMSEDEEIFYGRVTKGYFSENESERINEGERVKFSKKKIAGRFKI